MKIAGLLWQKHRHIITAHYTADQHISKMLYDGSEYNNNAQAVSVSWVEVSCYIKPSLFFLLLFPHYSQPNQLQPMDFFHILEHDKVVKPLMYLHCETEILLHRCLWIKVPQSIWCNAIWCHISRLYITWKCCLNILGICG